MAYRKHGLAILSACACAIACATSTAQPTRTVAPEDARRGRALYDRYCALCHGAGAVGYAADNASQLANRTFLATASDEFLRIAIERGRPGTPMSAFGAAHGGPLHHREIDLVIAYLRSLQRVDPVDVDDRVVEGDSDRGRAVFAARCASCHGERGEGKTAISLNNPIFLATTTPGFIGHAIEHGRPGTPMPAFGGVLSAQQIDDVTSLIGSWGRSVSPSAPVAGVELPPLDRIVIHPDGPRPSFTLREGRYVPADDVAKALESGARMILLDARPLSDWHRGHIPGAYPTPFYDELDALAAALPRDGTWIIAYCACPHAASGKVVDALRARGFTGTAVLDEGILVWQERGYPMQVTAAAPATK
jgi:mono/diheme cytochrome c family protein/rhodanese-related sulfurtransferase